MDFLYIGDPFFPQDLYNILDWEDSQGYFSTVTSRQLRRSRRKRGAFI